MKLWIILKILSGELSLTIVLKIVFEHFESTRWLSILLGPDEFPIGKQNTNTHKKENLKIETETG